MYQDPVRPFGTGTLPNVRPLMACRTSEVLVYFGSLAGAHSHAGIASLIISITAGPDVSFTRWNWASWLCLGLPISRNQSELVLPALVRGPRSGNSHHPLCHLPYSLVLTVQRFQRITLLFVLPLVQPMDHRTLEAVDLGFQSGIPRDLPLPPQSVVQAHFILNTIA
jgi:hypothetical protein